MERKLYIIRHGKSSWDEEGIDDIDRPLAKRGLRNADTMARRLKDAGTIPEMILTSPANRALNTALIMSGIWGLDASDLHIRDSLYMAYTAEIEEVISVVPGEIRRLAIYGHNPSFTIFANKFLDDPLANLPTAGTVIITFESDGWSGLNRGMVTDTCVDFPKRKA